MDELAEIFNAAANLLIIAAVAGTLFELERKYNAKQVAKKNKEPKTDKATKKEE
jgi:hypothetical protein